MTERERPSVSAWVEARGERHLLDAHHASRYSVWVRFREGRQFKNSTEFSRLVLQVNGEDFDAGPCRLVVEPNIDGFAGRLVALGDFCDFESLFFKRRVDRLHAPFVNLPLLLGHKDHVKPEFRDYIADLTYDLSVFRNVFDALDVCMRDEPEGVIDLVESGIVQNEGREFMSFLDAKLEELGSLVSDYTFEEHKRHGFYLRKQLWHILMSVPIMRRTNLKPRGYAGDSEMMRMIYADHYQGDSLFAKILNKHTLEQPGAQAVRNRCRLIADALRAYSDDHPSRIPVKVLSVACGPAKEIEDILLVPEDSARFTFTMFDQDHYALMEAAKMITGLEHRLDTTITVDYLRESVRTMLATRELESEWGPYDFIYSMGLFDYLTPPVARAVLRKLYRLLSPGGALLIGNFHPGNPSRCFMEYWLDWAIYYRTKDDLAGLARRVAGDAQWRVLNDRTEVQLLLELVRPMADK